MEENAKNKFSKWLEILQQESWQLELIISGFAIFLLLATYGPLMNLQHQIDALSRSTNDYSILMLPYALLVGAWYALVVNMVGHVLLRGVWISTVGLRYVSEEIDFDSLRYRPKYDGFLRRSIKSFDHYISQLEKYCSIVFAFTFLIVFMMLSVGMFVGVLYVLNAVIFDYMPGALGANDNHWLRQGINSLFLLSSVIYFLDFVTLGWFKRRKWFLVFYPFYRLMGWITLAFLYRPLYYNLIDNKFGRRISILLVPYIIGAMVISSLSLQTHAYLPKDSDTLYLQHAYYDDSSDPQKVSNKASIPSKYIGGRFLELFLPYNPKYDDRAIKLHCPELEPARKTGLKLEGVINSGELYNRKAKADSILTCMSQMQEVYIDDSLYTDIKYRFYHHQKRRDHGLLTIINVGELTEGEHLLEVKTLRRRRRNQRDTLLWRTSALIPFWKE